MHVKRTVLLLLCCLMAALATCALAGPSQTHMLSQSAFPYILPEKLPRALPTAPIAPEATVKPIPSPTPAVPPEDVLDYLTVLPIKPGDTFEAYTLPLPAEYTLHPMPIE